MANRGDDKEARRAAKTVADASTVETASNVSQDLAFAATLAHAEAGEGVDLVGRRLAHFRIASRLGAGGMGVVYRAEDETLHRPVALKIVSFARDRGQQKEHLLREARSAAAVTHASIAAIYEVNEADGVAFIAMEFVEGATLRARVRARVPWQEAARFGLEIAQGLARAHEQRIVHRDLKPENVIVTPQGHVKILDFGIAMPLDDDASEGALRGIVGTPPYMSPEQAQGNAVDARSDVFSFGVLLYELLAGELPFQRAESRHPQLWGDIDGPEWKLAAPLRAKCPNVPEAIEAIVNRALARRAEERFANGAELATALETALASLARSDAPRTSRLRIALGIAAIAAIVSGVSIVTLRRMTPAPPVGEPVLSEAMKALRNGIQEMRDANDDAARSDFEHAAEIDPGLGAAHLRRAALAYFPDATARAHFEKATRLKGGLDAHDKALFDAIEPWMRDPSDITESIKRFDSAVASSPNDVEIGLFSCRMRFLDGESRETLNACDRVLALDERVAKAWQLKGLAYADQDDVEGARKAYAQCLSCASSAMLCQSNLFRLDATEGRCSEALEVSRRMVAASPSLSDGHRFLASALYATGQPLDGARLALERAWERDDAAWRSKRIFEQPALDILAGDFDSARRDYATWSATIATSPSDDLHEELLISNATFDIEVGNQHEADALAVSYEARMPAWSATAALLYPLYPLAIRYLSGGISRAEMRAKREEWLLNEESAHRLRRGGPGMTWLNAYALTAKTAEDGREAVAALPRFLPLPAVTFCEPDIEEPIGRTFALAGDRERALIHLRGAADSCWALLFPVAHTVANLELGELLETMGDVHGACIAYRRVVERWGSSPTSVSGKKARARVVARCDEAH